MWLVLFLLKPQEQGYRSLREITRSYTQPNEYLLGVDLKVHAVPPCPGVALPCMRYVSPKGQKWQKGSVLQLRVMWVRVLATPKRGQATPKPGHASPANATSYSWPSQTTMPCCTLEYACPKDHGKACPKDPYNLIHATPRTYEAAWILRGL